VNAVSRSRRVRQRGLAMITFALALGVIVPALGLGVDTALLYVVKERLTSAAQLAVRSAARSAEPEKAAQRFFDANFPKGFMGVEERTLAYQPGKLRATVKAPTYFMRVFRVPVVTVEAIGEMVPAAAAAAAVSPVAGK
jgi:uncharacterized membrane protein